jgi:hypothetical protein
MSPKCSRRSLLKGTGISGALLGLPGGAVRLSAGEITCPCSFEPKSRNAPVGEARGIHPGRVVWAYIKGGVKVGQLIAVVGIC